MFFDFYDYDNQPALVKRRSTILFYPVLIVSLRFRQYSILESIFTLKTVSKLKNSLYVRDVIKI